MILGVSAVIGRLVSRWNHGVGVVHQSQQQLRNDVWVAGSDVVVLAGVRRNVEQARGLLRLAVGAGVGWLGAAVDCYRPREALHVG